MILKPFSRRLFSAAETMVKAPSTKPHLPPSLFLASAVKQRHNNNSTIRTMQEFVARIPDVVAERKQHNILPGSPNCLTLVDIMHCLSLEQASYRELMTQYGRSRLIHTFSHTFIWYEGTTHLPQGGAMRGGVTRKGH